MSKYKFNEKILETLKDPKGGPVRNLKILMIVAGGMFKSFGEKTNAPDEMRLLARITLLAYVASYSIFDDKTKDIAIDSRELLRYMGENSEKIHEAFQIGMEAMRFEAPSKEEIEKELKEEVKKWSH